MKKKTENRTELVPAKSLGQHFLKDESVAEKIAGSLSGHLNYSRVLEIGPGSGMLTQFILKDNRFDLSVIETDHRAVDLLKKKFKLNEQQLIHDDFLRFDLNQFSEKPFAIIGNFPYNISTQILFRIYDHRNIIPEAVGMFQKEVAERIASPPGNKSYGIPSVLLQAFYHIELLFDVAPALFYPVPKVNSSVIRMRRNEVVQLDCDEKLFVQLVKAGFNQRRKTLRNALRKFFADPEPCHPLFQKRAEQLSWKDFEALTHFLSDKKLIKNVH